MKFIGMHPFKPDVEIWDCFHHMVARHPDESWTTAYENELPHEIAGAGFLEHLRDEFLTKHLTFVRI